MPLKMCPYISLTGALCLSVFGYCLGTLSTSGERERLGPNERLFRGPNEKKKVELYFWPCGFSLMLACLLFWMGWECIWPALEALLPWQRGGVALAILFHGSFPVLLFDFVKSIKARRNVYRFLTDCRADGSLRAIHEKASEYKDEWVVHDMRQDGHNLSQLAKCAVQGYYYKAVLIVMNIPAEQVLQKLAQYSLLTKNGHERLPPAKTGNIFPKGGSSVLFYHQAEYVRIRG